MNPDQVKRASVCPIICLLVLGLLTACNDKPTPPDRVKIVNGTSYFPMHDGDTWYYNSGNFVRKVEGDTTINGKSCKRVLLGSEIDQAWTINSERFSLHLLLQSWWMSPALDIPLDLVKNEPYQFSSLARLAEGYESTDTDSFRIFGSVTFSGYVTRTISQVELDSCIKLDYNSTTRFYLKNGSSQDDVAAYTEYYAPGIGLIDDGSWVLDAAIIDGVDQPAPIR